MTVIDRHCLLLTVIDRHCLLLTIIDRYQEEMYGSSVVRLVLLIRTMADDVQHILADVRLGYK